MRRCRLQWLPYCAPGRMCLPLLAAGKGWSGCRRLIALGWLCLLCQLPPLYAYTVELEGAGQFSKLLDEHLDIRRHQDDPNVGIDELQRLAGRTPQQIRELLATQGYFSPTVSHEVTQDGGQQRVRFTIDPGVPTRIAAVEIRFDGALAEGPDANPQRMERLRRQWGLKPGEIFAQSAWTDAKNALLKNLLIRDFPAATIKHSEARIDPMQHSATLTLAIDSGPAFTFGELQVEGLERYSRGMVDRLNTIEPGERYSQEKLNELQSRLADTGYFRSVFPSVEIDPAQPLLVPIKLTLSENRRQRLALGVGVSTDTGAGVQVKWLDRQFAGRDWRFESELELNRETHLLGADLYLPPISNGWTPSFNARTERTNTSGEINDTVRTGARLTSPDRRNEQAWGVAFFADRQQLPGLAVNNRQALIATYRYTRRTVNNLLAPRRGYVASIELGAGPAGLINESNILLMVARATWLKPLPRRWQAVVRGQVGQVFLAERSVVPGDLLFRTGGAQSVRGYGYNSLGVAQSGAVVGGRVVAVFSAEMVYRITPAWGAAFFHDAGDATDAWRDFDLKHGTGVGARWRSPIGPVNLDLAYGHATGKPQLHFSVGYVF